MKIKRLSSLIDKTIGLAFQNDIKPVFFQTRWGIHTFFVRSPIDVVICSDHLIVRKIVHNLKPWRLLFWNPKYKNVFEFPANDPKTKTIKIGSKLKI